MSLSLTPKKAIVAIAALAPLFVAGCSSADEETAAKNTSTVTSTSATSSATPTDDPEKKDEHDKDEDKDKDGKPGEHKPQDQAAAGNPNGAGAQGGHSGQPVNPFGNDANAQRLNVAPVEGGQPADDQTANELRQLLEGQYQQNNAVDFFTYMPKNTCSAVLNEIEGGAQAFNVDNFDPQTRQMMDQLFQVAPNESGIEAINDVQRNGDRASATVRVRTPQGIDEAVQRFQHEGGQWKFCK